MTKNLHIPFFVDVTVLNGNTEELGKINLNLVTHVKRTKVNKIWDEERGIYKKDEATAVFFINGTSIHIRDNIAEFDME